MKRNRESLVSRALHDQSGQVIPWVVLAMVMLLSMAAFVIDIGNAFVCYRELQASTDAAALAGAEVLPASNAAATAIAYSSVAGNKNAQGNLTNVAMVSGYPLLKCLTSLKNIGMACVSPASANAIQVKQTAQVPTIFAGIFGFKNFTLTASATASMRGSNPTPYNVAILVDTTASMSTTDTDCGSLSRLACALQGVQVLMQNLSPCAASLATCTITNGMAANSVDRVSLFTFPNVTVGTASKEFDCSSTNPTTVPYSFPSTSAVTYAPTGSTTATYQVLGYQSDYRTSDTSATLNSGSNLTMAVGAKSGCTGMGDPGGEGTYYAGAIYAAQASLVAEQAAYPGSQNVIIILSDGDATANSSQMASGATNSGTYPSYVNECGQAVTAALAATAAGTRVYSVAYGSAGSGCGTDTSGTYKGITPCQTMQKIASAPQYFFSDYNQSGSGSTCQSASQPTTNLSQIFTQIAADMTVARLIPDSST